MTDHQKSMLMLGVGAVAVFGLFLYLRGGRSGNARARPIQPVAPGTPSTTPTASAVYNIHPLSTVGASPMVNPGSTVLVFGSPAAAAHAAQVATDSPAGVGGCGCSGCGSQSSPCNCPGANTQAYGSPADAAAAAMFALPAALQAAWVINNQARLQRAAQAFDTGPGFTPGNNVIDFGNPFPGGGAATYVPPGFTVH